MGVSFLWGHLSPLFLFVLERKPKNHHYGIDVDPDLSRIPVWF